jgi:hypothetical protein
MPDERGTPGLGQFSSQKRLDVLVPFLTGKHRNLERRMRRGSTGPRAWLRGGGSWRRCRLSRSRGWFWKKDSMSFRLSLPAHAQPQRPATPLRVARVEHDQVEGAFRPHQESARARPGSHASGTPASGASASR